MRAFFAVLPPSSAHEDLVAHLQPRRDADTGRDWRWTREEHLHLTLAFLPDLPDRAEDPLVESVSAWAARQEPAPLSLGGAGAFPDPGGAKVIWIGVDEGGAGSLRAWSRSLRDHANHAGAEVDGQRFTPHVTVARSSRRRPAGRWVQALDAYRGPRFVVEEIVLIASHLGQGAGGSPRYEVRHRFPLGGPVGG
ncbi:RNA 2',3'-cyclic phosphodiesterase [Ornithinicoccus hortensis]|uniref:RNA 2',3'-cyclic phosphodiesterase n=1 Tax=Ornithinicoccus hortensis TaxID=82346 RepID=A0A542YM23_9MICO|nr:RNA 2',3'-cyclic phosphodiesterase [Ornithinicoccus hortensis]TQL49138.1 2'-5' RNA ligase [Ornithinicoccus hortensis]